MTARSHLLPTPTSTTPTQITMSKILEGVAPAMITPFTADGKVRLAGALRLNVKS